MTRLLAIATNTFREAVRDRVLHSILFFAVGAVLFSLVLEQVTIGDQDRVVRGVAMGAIDLFASVIAMFLGISLVYKELERRTVYTILSKPIPRWMFVLGKYLGLMGTMAVELGILALFYVVLMLATQGAPSPTVFVAFFTMYLGMGLLTAWATLFSCYSAPMTASFFSLSVFLIGHLADDIWTFGNLAESPQLRQLSRALYWVLPNLEIFNLRLEAVSGAPIPWERVGLATSYGLCYTVLVLVGAILIFERRDVK